MRVVTFFLAAFLALLVLPFGIYVADASNAHPIGIMLAVVAMATKLPRGEKTV